MDAPLNSEHLPHSWDCCASVAGAGPRLLMLGVQGGLFAARLMTWSERLRTLQVCVCVLWGKGGGQCWRG